MEKLCNRYYTVQPYGVTVGGDAVEEYTLVNRSGMKVSVITLGGIITQLIVPDRNGVFDDITPGFKTLAEYESNPAYFGAIIGRFGNRIAGGEFSIDGEHFTLAQNNGMNCMHGGTNGFDKQIWKAKPFETDESVGIILTYLSADGEEGFPGNLKVKVIYRLNDENELSFEYSATSDKATVCNLTQHTYFNLSGHDSGSIASHNLRVYAKYITAVNEKHVPTGALSAVAGTPFDFTELKPIGERIDEADEQLHIAGGYDHNWVLVKGQGAWGKAAQLFDPESGRSLEVWTTEPGLQVYSGNFLDGSQIGKGGKSYQHRSAIALETQHYPDSPNQPHFPSTRLNPGEIYQSKTAYRFSVDPQQ